MVTLVLPPTRGALAEVLIPVNGLAGKHGCRSERAALPPAQHTCDFPDDRLQSHHASHRLLIPSRDRAPRLEGLGSWLDSRPFRTTPSRRQL